jgi:hypothetical protein
MTLGVPFPTQALHQDGARKPGVSVSVRDPQWLERVRLTRFILVQRLRFGTDSFNPSTLGVCCCRSLLGICDKLGVSNHVERVRSGLREEESADDECSVSSPSRYRSRNSIECIGPDERIPGERAPSTSPNLGNDL